MEEREICKLSSWFEVGNKGAEFLSGGGSLKQGIEVKLAKGSNGYVGNSSNFQNTIFIGPWVKHPRAAIGILSHDSIHLALTDVGEYSHFHPVAPLLKGCLGVEAKEENRKECGKKWD